MIADAVTQLLQPLTQPGAPLLQGLAPLLVALTLSLTLVHANRTWLRPVELALLPLRATSRPRIQEAA